MCITVLLLLQQGAVMHHCCCLFALNHFPALAAAFVYAVVFLDA